jgi:hypothetical protein
MPSDPVFYLYACVFLILLCLPFCRFWPGGNPPPAVPKPPRRKREPKPFAGYTRKPECEWCKQPVQLPPQALGALPPRMRFTRGRRRQIETTGHFCPHAASTRPIDQDLPASMMQRPLRALRRLDRYRFDLMRATWVEWFGSLTGG